MLNGKHVNVGLAQFIAYRSRVLKFHALGSVAHCREPSRTQHSMEAVTMEAVTLDVFIVGECTKVYSRVFLLLIAAHISNLFRGQFCTITSR